MYGQQLRVFQKGNLILVAVLLVIGFTILNDRPGVSATPDEEPWKSPVPVVFEGTHYDAQAFNQLLATELSNEELILVPAELSETEPFLYAFRTVDEAVGFLTQMRETREDALAPMPLGPPIEGQSTTGISAEGLQSTYTFFDYVNYGGSSLTTYYDLADLGTVGSGWNNRISSVFVSTKR